MRVSLEHVEKKTGMVFKKTLYGVQCRVDFTEEEKQIIDQRKLETDVLLERDWSADVDGEKKESRGLGRKLASAAFSGMDSNHPHLTIRKLMRGDTHFFTSIGEAKGYEQELREGLQLCKNWVEANAEKGEASTFEL